MQRASALSSRHASAFNKKVIRRSRPEEEHVKGTKILTFHRLAKIVDLTKEESLHIRS
jgi:hypothetical protein